MNWIGGLMLGTASIMASEQRMNVSVSIDRIRESAVVTTQVAATSAPLITQAAGPQHVGPMLMGGGLINAVQLSLDDPSGTSSADGSEADSQDGGSKSAADSAHREKRQVLVFKATWCGACQSLNYEWPALKKVRWRVSSDENAHFRLVDADEHPDLISRYGITQLPTILLVVDGEVKSRRGSLGARDLAELYYGRLR